MKAHRIYLQQKTNSNTLSIILIFFVNEALHQFNFILMHLEHYRLNLGSEWCTKKSGVHLKWEMGITHIRNGNNVQQTVGKNHIVAAAMPNPHQKSKSRVSKAESTLPSVSAIFCSTHQDIPALENIRVILSVCLAWAKMKETKIAIIWIFFLVCSADRRKEI